jgi:hypothetical protein
MCSYPLDLTQNEIATGPKVFPLKSIKHLERLLMCDRKELIELSEKVGSFYKPFDRQKFGTEKWRHIDNPTGKLKQIQSKINKKLLNRIILPETMLGGVKGKSIFDNAAPHLDKKMIVTLDLKNCFPRINHEVILSIFINGLKCSEEIARILTKLTTFQTRLPQGASTSTMLANMALLPLHNEISVITKQKNLDLTFFVDDIAISGDGKASLEVIQPIIKIIQLNNKAVSNRKIKKMPACTRQTITGLVANKTVGISNEKILAIYNKILGLYRNPNTVSKNDLRSIYGKIVFVKRIKPSRGVFLEKVAKKYLPADSDLISRFKLDKTRPCKCTQKHSEPRHSL